MFHPFALCGSVANVVPLAIPMMAGPGAMITAMVYMGESVNVLEWGFIVFCLIMTVSITYILLKESQYIYELMGNLGITATLRIMGILIASIGVQMMLNNVLDFAALF